MKCSLSHKLMLTSYSIATLVALSACGPKKEVSLQGGPAPTQTEAQLGTGSSKTVVHEGEQKVSDEKTNGKDTLILAEAPTNPNNEDSIPLPPPTAPSNGTGGSTLPPPPPPTAQNPAPTPTPTPVPQPPMPPPPNSVGSQPLPAPPKVPGNPANPPPKAPSKPSTPSRPIPTPPPVNRPPEPPAAPNPAPVAAGTRFTGLRDTEGLYYTSAGNDSLLAQLSEQQSTAETARKIVSARLNRTAYGMNLNIEIEEFGAVRTYILGGRMNGAQATSLQVLQTNGARYMEGSLQCMSANGGCEVAVATLVIGEQNGRGVVRMILRESEVDIDVNLPGRRSGNPEYEAMRRFWINSAYKEATSNKLKVVILNSFEIVNGRAGFDLQVIGENRQMMIFAAPLVSPRNSSDISVRADRTADIANLNEYYYDLANTIGSARVVRNDGRGGLDIQLKMRARAGYDQDVFTLTVKKNTKPILPLN